MKCQKCKERPGTLKWVGESGVMGLVHGQYEWWCECCVLREQLEYARKLAETIPTLETQLAQACKESVEVSKG